MPADARARLHRLLGIIPHFADGEEVSLAELTELTGVEAEVLLDDLRDLTDYVIEPAGYVGSMGIQLEPDRVSIHSSHFLRPMRLTLQELCALELGLAVLRGTRPIDERVLIDRTRERVRQVIVQLPAWAGELPWEASPLPLTDTPVHRVARDAVEAQRKLRIAYRKADATQAELRVVCPYALLPLKGTWYLVAHCLESQGIRFFRLDRIEGTETEEGVFERPADFSVDALVREGKAFSARDVQPMRVWYSPNIARWIAEREEGEHGADGSFVVEHRVADEGWAVRHVLQYGPDAEVLSPPSIRAAVASALEVMRA